jgi:L-asparaginase/Glu-tRNA(Gln) amidotransferase subunit D
MKTFVVLTGGTFGSSQGANGLTVSQNEQISVIYEKLKGSPQANTELTFVQPIKKLSENMDPKDWETIITCIFDNLDNHDNILIIHGTDTLAYTAAAISYIEQLSKKYPIVLTGANFPLEAENTDAIVNTVQSLIALNYFSINNIVGAFIVFNGTNNYHHTALIHPATKVKKDKWEEFCYRSFYLDKSAIGTVNGDGSVTFDITLYNQLFNNEILYPFLQSNFDAKKVVMLKIYPGMDPDIIKLLVDQKKKIIALEIYNSGTAPAFDTDFSLIESLEYAEKNGSIVCALSQHEGKKGATMNIYESSNILMKAGIIPLSNIIWEAASVKMMVACSNFENKNDIVKFLTTNIAAEIQNGDIV